MMPPPTILHDLSVMASIGHKLRTKIKSPLVYQEFNNLRKRWGFNNRMRAQGKILLQNVNIKSSQHTDEGKISTLGENIKEKPSSEMLQLACKSARSKHSTAPLFRHLAGKTWHTKTNATQNLRSAAETVILASHAFPPPPRWQGKQEARKQE